MVAYSMILSSAILLFNVWSLAFTSQYCFNISSCVIYVAVNQAYLVVNNIYRLVTLAKNIRIYNYIYKQWG